MTIGDRIKRRRELLGLSVEEVAKHLGKHRATIYRYENNEIENFPTDVLEPLAVVLQTTPAYLMGWPDISSDLPDNILPVSKMRRIPLLRTLARSEPILTDENLDGDVDIPENIHADFALRCKGDSMINARIFDGDIAYIRIQKDVENGEIAAVRIGDETTLKRVYRHPARLELRPENPTFPVLQYEGEQLEDVQIIGKAVAFTSAVR